MHIGLIGVGRMGKVLASRLAGVVDLTLYDMNPEYLEKAAAELGAKAAKNLEEVAATDAVILVVPDREVIACIKEFNTIKQKQITVINIATNVAQQVLEQTAAPHVRPISAKFVGQADEIASGARPVIIVHERPSDLTPLARELFSHIGDVLVGNSDMVTTINTVAAEKVLEAAVQIEETLRQKGFADPAIAKSAIGQVAAGILKAYAADDLGPFAREIVRAVRKKMRQ